MYKVNIFYPPFDMLSVDTLYITWSTVCQEFKDNRLLCSAAERDFSSRKTDLFDIRIYKYQEVILWG